MHLPTVLSPYELDGQSLGARVGLLLGQPASTLLPTPTLGTSDQAIEDAIEHSPGYLKLMERWRWSSPLWNAGILVRGLEPQGPLPWIRAAARDFDRDRTLATLTQRASPPGTPGPSPTATDTFDDDGVYLQALSEDLRKGGVRPAVVLAVTAGLEAYSAATGATLVRTAAQSTAGKHEDRSSRRIARAVLRMPTPEKADEILETREELAPELDAVRSVISKAGSTAEQDLRDAAHDLENAVRTFGDLPSTQVRLELRYQPIGTSFASARAALGDRTAIGATQNALSARSCRVLIVHRLAWHGGLEKG